MKQYNKSEIDIISKKTSSAGGTEIVYRPILDSLYYCPGVTIRSSTDRTGISFVRCGIKDKCKADISSENIGAGQFKVVVPFSPSQVDLVFGDVEEKLLR
jgi:hypothetical protein